MRDKCEAGVSMFLRCLEGLDFDTELPQWNQTWRSLICYSCRFSLPLFLGNNLAAFQKEVIARLLLKKLPLNVEALDSYYPIIATLLWNNITPVRQGSFWIINWVQMAFRLGYDRRLSLQYKLKCRHIYPISLRGFLRDFFCVHTILCESHVKKFHCPLREPWHYQLAILSWWINLSGLRISPVQSLW